LESEYLSVLTLWQLAFEISNFTQIMGLGEWEHAETQLTCRLSPNYFFG
jgi:hypothetical protein